MLKKYIAWDVEISKTLPDGETDWLNIRQMSDPYPTQKIAEWIPSQPLPDVEF